ncbi:Rap1a/Tai family immunity protein [Rhizobium sp. RHZ01]|uniref:Rap1a/Tai family immunity protein n=1 Tax=Rhizobium sp. RHZ01 TaxID=2769304 RepID=UPI00178082E6|nr:Rap1a/Tai family immunity protein [Rhizobium sp. RHZ01]MBD9444886.1 hypothetical protein [Rhizobium sp. RHZ01]
MIRLSFAVAAALLSASTCFAGVCSYQNGNALLADCSSKASTLKAFCIGYIEGVIDGLEVTGNITGAGQCLRYEVTGGQLMDVVVKSLRKNPETRHNAAAALVVFAVANAFCSGDAA